MGEGHREKLLPDSCLSTVLLGISRDVYCGEVHSARQLRRYFDLLYVYSVTWLKYSFSGKADFVISLGEFILLPLSKVKCIEN